MATKIYMATNVYKRFVVNDVFSVLLEKFKYNEKYIK